MTKEQIKAEATKAVGKKILSINTSSCNFWIINFTDGTQLQLETMPVLNVSGGSIHGIVPKFEVVPEI